jgi:glycosyltransferase involved in cell wall biosynthesis
MLRKDFPALKLRLAGTISERGGYGRFLRRRIRELGLHDCVEFLGYLDGPAMAQALASSHAFVMTSFIENSPNSLAEAMLVGMPCVASFVGGIPSMVKHNETGLLYPAGDVTMLGAQIRRLFRERELASRLGESARKVALTRHDPDTVIDQLVTAYGRLARLAGQP